MKIYSFIIMVLVVVLPGVSFGEEMIATEIPGELVVMVCYEAWQEPAKRGSLEAEDPLIFVSQYVDREYQRLLLASQYVWAESLWKKSAGCRMEGFNERVDKLFEDIRSTRRFVLIKLMRSGMKNEAKSLVSYYKMSQEDVEFAFEFASCGLSGIVSERQDEERFRQLAEFFQIEVEGSASEYCGLLD